LSKKYLAVIARPKAEAISIIIMEIVLPRPDSLTGFTGLAKITRSFSDFRTIPGNYSDQRNG
jgi:hypothetical protein